MSHELFKELSEWKAPVVELNLEEKNRLFQKMSASYIEKYNSEPHTKKLINQTWKKGFWGVLGEIVGFEYNVPKCNRTEEEIVRLEEENRAILLLPDNIFTSTGLRRLATVFPLRMSWAEDQEEIEKISHISKKGGCVDVEMQLTAPYAIPGGYSKSELEAKISDDHRFSQRLPTALVASVFSQITRGHPLDGLNTYSRTGSFYQEEASAPKEPLAVIFEEGHFEVRKCPPDKRDSSLGGRSEGVSEKNNYIWRRVPYFVERSKGRKVA